MIEIITAEVKMPPFNERRFGYEPRNNKWVITDNGKIIGTRKYEDAAIIAHNLNKKYYLSLLSDVKGNLCIKTT